MTAVEEVILKAKSLPEIERAQVIDALLDTLNPDFIDDDHDLFDPAFRREIERRSQAIDAGEMPLVSWEALKARLLAMSS